MINNHFVESQEMEHFFVLIIAFMVSVIAAKLSGKKFNYAFSGRISMAFMLFFTALGHFVFRKGMSLTIPRPIPYKSEIIFLPGGLEIMEDIGLLVSCLSLIAAWLLMAFFILILQANVYVAVHKSDSQKDTFVGDGLSYLWF